MNQIKRDHGHRAVAGLTKERIEEKILKPLSNKPVHFCIITTEYGKPFTVDGFSGWMRDAIRAAGITNLKCQSCDRET